MGAEKRGRRPVVEWRLGWRRDRYQSRRCLIKGFLLIDHIHRHDMMDWPIDRDRINSPARSSSSTRRRTSEAYVWTSRGVPNPLAGEDRKATRPDQSAPLPSSAASSCRIRNHARQVGFAMTARWACAWVN